MSRIKIIFNKMKKIFLTIVLGIFSIISLYSQTQATTNDGKKVILNDDGTWKFSEETKSQTVEIDNSDCSKYILTDVDKVTGKSSTAAKDMLVISQDGGKNGFGIYLLKGSNSIILSIKAVGAGNCIDDDNKMNILFRDGTRLELVNDSKFNCDAKYTQYFGGVFGKKKELEMFKTKEIETMRIWTSESYVQENFTPEQSKEFMNTINCLVNI
jgi:hypothetical protein